MLHDTMSFRMDSPMTPMSPSTPSANTSTISSITSSGATSPTPMYRGYHSSYLSSTMSSVNSSMTTSPVPMYNNFNNPSMSVTQQLQTQQQHSSHTRRHSQVFASVPRKLQNLPTHSRRHSQNFSTKPTNPHSFPYPLFQNGHPYARPSTNEISPSSSLLSPKLMKTMPSSGSSSYNDLNTQLSPRTHSHTTPLSSENIVVPDAETPTTGQIFQSKLQEVMANSKSPLATGYLNFDRLRIIIKRIVYYESQCPGVPTIHDRQAENEHMPDNNNNNNNINNSASVPRTSSRNQSLMIQPNLSDSNMADAMVLKERIQKHLKSFWDQLRKQITTMNDLFTWHEGDCMDRLSQLKFEQDRHVLSLFDNANLSQKFNVSTHAPLDPVCGLFRKLIASEYTEMHKRIGLSQENDPNDPSMNDDTLDNNNQYYQQEQQNQQSVPSQPQWTSRFRSFIEVCQMVDELQRYVIINYAILWRILHTFNKHTQSQVDFHMLSSIIKDPFKATGKLEALIKRTHMLSLHLSGIQPMCPAASNSSSKNRQLNSSTTSESSFTCTSCQCPTSVVIRLSCSHTFCLKCALQHPTFCHMCVLCSANQNLDTMYIHVEDVPVAFPAIVRWKVPESKSIKAEPEDAPKSTRGRRARTHRSSLSSPDSLQFISPTSKSTSSPVTLPDPSTLNFTQYFERFRRPKSLSKTGTCHQCKLTNEGKDLLFCEFRPEKGNGNKRACRKRFCSTCLQSMYSLTQLVSLSTGRDWICPSCFGICSCRSCLSPGNRLTPKHSDSTDEQSFPEQCMQLTDPPMISPSSTASSISPHSVCSENFHCSRPATAPSYQRIEGMERSVSHDVPFASMSNSYNRMPPLETTALSPQSGGSSHNSIGPTAFRAISSFDSWDAKNNATVEIQMHDVNSGLLPANNYYSSSHQQLNLCNPGENYHRQYINESSSSPTYFKPYAHMSAGDYSVMKPPDMYDMNESNLVPPQSHYSSLRIAPNTSNYNPSNYSNDFIPSHERHPFGEPGHTGPMIKDPSLVSSLTTTSSFPSAIGPLFEDENFEIPYL
jgi:hypothetical protein